MLHRIHYRFKNVPLSVLTGLSVFLAVLVPLLIGSVLFYFRSRSYLLELEGTSLSTSLSTLHSSEDATPDAISADTERLLRQLSSDKAYSYYILDEDDAVVASDSRGEIIFPLEQYPSEQNIAGGYLLHSSDYRGETIYAFSRPNNRYTVVAIWPVSNFSGAWRVFLVLIPITFLSALVLVIAVLILLRVYFIVPTKRLLLTMRNPSMEAKISTYTEWNNEVGRICASYLDRFREYRDSLEEINRLNTEQRASEIEVLQNQINAHFIYNTLNNIQWLASAGRMEDVVRTAQSLDILLRACAKNESDYVTIEEEITYVDAYLSSQKIRFGNVFDYEFDLDPFLMQMKIPKFIVQPIVENSIYHGFLDAGRTGGHIRVSLCRQGHRIIIEVYDNGIGIAPEDILPILNNTQKSSDRYMGVAIGNINKRIYLLCGREYGIGIESRRESFTKVQIIVPIIP